MLFFNKDPVYGRGGGTFGAFFFAVGRGHLLECVSPVPFAALSARAVL